MKVSIDKKLCANCGLCTEVCPEVFETVDGVTKVKEGANLSDQGVVEKAKTAKEMCPSGAIVITE